MSSLLQLQHSASQGQNEYWSSELYSIFNHLPAGEVGLAIPVKM
jgi:hypothetical protein